MTEPSSVSAAETMPMPMPATNPQASTPLRSAFAVLAVCITFISSPLFAANPRLAHTITIDVRPDTGEIAVEDTIHIDRPSARFEFVLNAGLTVRSESGELSVLHTSENRLRTAYRVTLQTPSDTIKLHYHGKPMFSGRRSLGDMPQGVIAPRGVYLDASSSWYPQFERDFDALSMTVKLPEGWQSVSIGRRDAADGVVTWTSELPHDDLYLIAGRFTRHAQRHGDIDLSVRLLDDDPALAARYLPLMADYIDHYSRLIGSYPYAKFAVVENPWQTGFGMPSFTLLGSRVLRLPFIPYTSLPHEILHNWWGNGVWVDYDKGNWSEGLTAYLADHWMQERAGKGDQYRLKALQNYSNFAAQGEDAPLLDFISRHNDSSQSIGYSKSLMLFHMLRNTLGDQRFIAGLRQLWQQHRYQRVGFAETVRSITAPDTALARRFMPWLERSGAPQIGLDRVQVQPLGDGWQLVLAIVQQQAEPFEFDLPLAITLEGEAHARHETAHIAAERTTISYQFENRPLRVDVDPEYDLLRYLDPTEQPPALNRLFGSRQAWLVVPAAATPEVRAAWAALGTQWQARYPGLKLIDDSAAADLDPRADRLLLGWDNALLPAAREAFTRDDQVLREHSATIAGTDYPADAAGVVLVNTDVHGVTTGFIGADAAAEIQALARKLTHYGSYGRLVFDKAGNNRLRDTLSSSHSRLSRQLGDTPVALHLAPRQPLGD